MPPRLAFSTSAFHRLRLTLACALLLGLLAPLIGSAHRHTDAWAPRHEVTDEVRYLPTGRLLRAASLGYEMLFADVLWARTTLLFGKNVYRPDRRWYAWLFHMIDLSTDLDPRFKAAYKYGGLMLRFDGVFVDQSSLIFQKGMVGRPDLWDFPFGIAMNYFMHKKDRETAARYMEMAARMDGSPFYLRNLAASLHSESGDLESALAFLQEELRSLPEDRPELRSAVQVKIRETEYLIARRDATRVVEEYRRRAGDLPARPQDVSGMGLSLPVDPLGGAWDWDPDPEAEIGTVWSSEWCSVFSAIAQEHGLGRRIPFGCPGNAR